MKNVLELPYLTFAILFTMPHKCCVPNCNSGYRSCKDTEMYAMFRFPRDVDLKNKWLSAIPRKNWNVTGNTRVCSKHFKEKDFKVSSTDKRVKRRQFRKTSQLCTLVLKSFAISHIFPGLPSYYNVKTSFSRCTSASSSPSRVEKENKRIKQQYSKFWAEDAIESLHNLKKFEKFVTSRGLLQCGSFQFHYLSLP